MYLATDRLIIRSLQPSDEAIFIEMASDGSLTEIASCRTLEKAGFVVTETKMYQDMYDECEGMSNIYVHLNA